MYRNCIKNIYLHALGWDIAKIMKNPHIYIYIYIMTNNGKTLPVWSMFVYLQM